MRVSHRRNLVFSDSSKPHLLHASIRRYTSHIYYKYPITRIVARFVSHHFQRIYKSMWLIFSYCRIQSFFKFRIENVELSLYGMTIYNAVFGGRVKMTDYLLTR